MNNSQNNDKRLIEDYIPIRQISAEASREKSIRKGHISTLHLWWARRPLTACRAAVFGALVPAPKNSQERATMAKFMIDLCKYNVSDRTIATARQKILEANGGKPPKVLDMFAGGGSIPLEALRLGCEAYALELNPVAHLIELCTLVYPQKYGKKLADEVEKWGKWVIERVKEEIGDLYPLIPDPENPPKEIKHEYQMQLDGLEDKQPSLKTQGGYLTPVAYLWTRTVKCPNPECGATVPLVRQTWLCRKKGRYIALRPIPDHKNKRVRFEVVSASRESDLKFDPAGFSQRGQTNCLFCGAGIQNTYVKEEAKNHRLHNQPIAIVCIKQGEQGKKYLPITEEIIRWPSDDEIQNRIIRLCRENGLTLPTEKLTGKLTDQLPAYGMLLFKDIFTSRQLLTLLTFVKYVKEAYKTIRRNKGNNEIAKVISTYLALVIDRVANFSSTMCLWNYTGGRGVVHVFGRQALPMTWDFPESNPLNPLGANWAGGISTIKACLEHLPKTQECKVSRGSASELPYPEEYFDAVITDPPYYDNILYADLSDYFYVWLKRSIGHLYEEHFLSELTPKKNEFIATPYQHKGDKVKARVFYENKMAECFTEARRVLKAGAILIVVYAHKTTAGWATLVEALKKAGFIVTEAWPLETERQGGFRINKAMLASSIFIVARKRRSNDIGDYVCDVRPELARIVRERVTTLLREGITGADLVIAAVGAGLRAYTQYARVELASGEKLDAKSYLDEVQREVLEVILEQVMKCDRHGVSGVDKPTQYYVLGRYQYGESIIPFDEANVLARGVGVELDGPRALTSGRNPLIKKSKDKVSFRNYLERGKDDRLGLVGELNGIPIIDILHRLLWLLDNNPGEIPNFLIQSQPDIGQLRLVAQALAGKALADEPHPGAALDTRTKEQQAIDRLLAAWKRIIEENLFLKDSIREVKK